MEVRASDRPSVQSLFSGQQSRASGTSNLGYRRLAVHFLAISISRSSQFCPLPSSRPFSLSPSLCVCVLPSLCHAVAVSALCFVIETDRDSTCPLIYIYTSVYILVKKKKRGRENERKAREEIELVSRSREHY